jgi:hypothetical protein
MVRIPASPSLRIVGVLSALRFHFVFRATFARLIFNTIVFCRNSFIEIPSYKLYSPTLNILQS